MRTVSHFNDLNAFPLSIQVLAPGLTDGPSLLHGVLPSQDLALLQDMQESVQQAFRELQAADAAASAVAQVDYCSLAMDQSVLLHRMHPSDFLHPCSS